MEKETVTKDQNNKLDEKESQPAVNNIIGDSCTNKEKEITTKSSKTQDAPCKIKGVLVHVQLSHTFSASGHVLSKTKSVSPIVFTFLTSLTHNLSMIKFCRKKINVTKFLHKSPFCLLQIHAC